MHENKRTVTLQDKCNLKSYNKHEQDRTWDKWIVNLSSAMPCNIVLVQGGIMVQV